MTMFRINAGKYRHVVTLQTKADNQNSYGETIDTNENWVDYFKTRVAILPISGKEVMSAEFMNSEITHRVHMRYVPKVIHHSHNGHKSSAFSRSYHHLLIFKNAI